MLHRVCVAAILSDVVREQMHVPSRRNCYELFGFDVMLDDQLNPWLIEVWKPS